MNDPVDIKTKKIFPQSVIKKFDKALVLEALEKDVISHWETWGKFQQVWTNRAYKTFNDFDKYIVLIYLIRDFWQQTADKFKYYSIEEFYALDKIEIDKINLIKISTELNIPKETIRRKVNELQQEGILSRDGKKIILRRTLEKFQRPDKSLEALSIFLQNKSKVLQGEDWFGPALNIAEIKRYIEKYFTIIWLRFLRLQIPFLLRHKANFGDLETWMIWGNVAVHHQKSLSLMLDRSLTIGKSQTGGAIIDYSNYYKNVTNVKIDQGVNASSISDITSIPRATVMRKLKWLVKQDLLKKNKKLEYVMKVKGKLNKRIEENLRSNHVFVAEFLTDFFDYYKNSNFKPASF